MQQQPQPVITSLQPVTVTASSVNNTHHFLESGGMLTLPSNNPVDDSNTERTGNTDSGLYPAQF